MELSERKKKILRAVIENYIQSAEPVGSKTIVEHANLDVSSATIRNEMVELETLGLLEQPHTSAGRVPSASGYRLYVNELMQEHRLSVQEAQSINEALRLKIREMDQVMTEAGRVISQMTKYPTFSLTTGNARMSIARFDLLLVEENAFIVVVMTNTQIVRTKLIRLSATLSETQLQILNTLLNTSFTGLTLDALIPEYRRIAAHAAGEAHELIQLVVSFTEEVLRELENHVVHTAGITNLLSQPEFQNVDQAEPLMNFLSDLWDSDQLPVSQGEQMKILIGPENVIEELKNTSVIMATYDIGDHMQGVIGVVGPTRMDYAKLAARLSYFAEGMSRMFGKGELPPAPKSDQS
ncbi:MAG: heat-inducible transcriptional repressor HrcA [Evtepia sp.]